MPHADCVKTETSRGWANGCSERFVMGAGFHGRGVFPRTACVSRLICRTLADACSSALNSASDTSAAPGRCGLCRRANDSELTL